MLTYLGDLLSVIGRVLRLDPDALAGLDPVYGPWAIPLGIMVIATVSSLIGEAVVLAINLVRGFRLVFTLVTSLIGVLLSYLVLGLALWATGQIVLDRAPEFTPLVQAVMLSAAPHVFGFLTMLPYSGQAIQRALSLWSTLSLWAIVQYEFGTGVWTALLITAVGSLAMMAASHFLGRPLAWLRDRLWRAMTGVHLMLTSQEILDAFPLRDDADPARRSRR